MIKRQIFLAMILLGGSIEIIAGRGGGGGGIRGGGGGVRSGGGFAGGRSFGGAPRSTSISRPTSLARPTSSFAQTKPGGFARPSSGYQAAARPLSRPQGAYRRPTGLAGYAGKKGLGQGQFSRSGLAGRIGENRVGGKFDLSRPRRFDSHRTERSVSNQRNFMNRRVGRHNWQWLAANNFPLFISTFPFAYNAQYGDYPPV